MKHCSSSLIIWGVSCPWCPWPPRLLQLCSLDVVALIQPFMLYLFHFSSFYLQYICVPAPPNGFFVVKTTPFNWLISHQSTRVLVFQSIIKWGPGNVANWACSMLFKNQLILKPKGKWFTQKWAEDNTWLTGQRDSRNFIILKDAVTSASYLG